MDAPRELDERTAERVRRIRSALKLFWVVPVLALVAGAGLLLLSDDSQALRIVAGAVPPVLILLGAIAYIALKKRAARLAGQQLAPEELLT